MVQLLSHTGRSTERNKCALNVLWVMSKLKWGKIEFKSFWHANFRQLWEKSTQKIWQLNRKEQKNWQIKRIHRISIPKNCFWRSILVWYSDKVAVLDYPIQYGCIIDARLSIAINWANCVTAELKIQQTHLTLM